MSVHQPITHGYIKQWLDTMIEEDKLSWYKIDKVEEKPEGTTVYLVVATKANVEMINAKIEIKGESSDKDQEKKQ